MKRIIIIALAALLAPLQPAGAWKKPSTTDLRGAGVVLLDSMRTAGGIAAGTVAAETLSVNADSLVLTSNAGQTKLFVPVGSDLCLYAWGQMAARSNGYTWIQIFDVAGNGNQSLSGFASLAAKLGAFDSTRIGGGATITKIDTSAAGDSTKLDFINGNRIMHLGTEVKP